jgi:hypothetical protein
VVFREPLLRWVKRVLGRPPSLCQTTERGIEEWIPEWENKLFVRKMNLPYFTRLLSSKGVKLLRRFPSQFTEGYVHFGTSVLSRSLHKLNELLPLLDRRGRLSMGNVLLFRKGA